jgi:hypothetical protein
MPVLFENTNKRPITIKQLLDSIQGEKDDMSEGSYITIDTDDGDGVLDLVVFCTEGKFIQLICKKLNVGDNEIRDLYLNYGDVMLNNPFKDFVSAVELKNILKELDPITDIYMCIDKGEDTLYPLNLVTRCDSKPCHALHLYCIEGCDILEHINMN